MVTKTPEELDDMSPADRKAHLESEKVTVFGHTKREEGIGSPGHETLNHFRALKQAEMMENEAPGTYEAALAAIWKRDPDRAKAIGLPKPIAKAA